VIRRRGLFGATPRVIAERGQNHSLSLPQLRERMLRFLRRNVFDHFWSALRVATRHFNPGGMHESYEQIERDLVAVT